MNARFLLDTNTISDLALGRSREADARFLAVSLAQVCTSAICFCEVLFGLERRPDNARLREAVMPLLAEIEILDWTAKSGAVYGSLRAEMERGGTSLASLDTLIAAHALEAGAILVSRDRAFRHVPGLAVEDWTAS